MSRRSSRGGGKGRSRGRPGRTASRDYPREARLNELLREIIAAEVERIDDERVTLLSITDVRVDAELGKARVYFSSLYDDPEVSLEVLEDLRPRLKRAIGSQTRLRRVPQLEFSTDHGVWEGGRVEAILRDLETDETSPPHIDETAPAESEPSVDGPTDGDGEGTS